LKTNQSGLEKQQNMLKKSEKCRGCPFFGDGLGFVPAEINPGSHVLILAQNPGEMEEQGVKVTGYQGKHAITEPHPPAPLIGPTGFYMNREFLPIAGMTRESASYDNAIRCRHNHTNNLPPLTNPEMREALWHCHQAYSQVPLTTELIVAQGEYALYAMTQKGMEVGHKVSDWRGYVLPLTPIGAVQETVNDVWTPTKPHVFYEGVSVDHTPVLVVNHLASLFKQPEMTIPAKRDWSKIPRILAGNWPQMPPKILTSPPPLWPTKFAFDTEYVPSNNHLIRYSMAYPPVGLFKPEVVLNIVVRVVEREEALYSSTVLTGKPTLILQNADADLDHFESIAGVNLQQGYTFEDTMHAHAVLHSGQPHDLNFLGSMYSPFNRWKHLVDTNPIVYAGCDAASTWYSWEALAREFKRDPQSEKVYREYQLPLVNIIRRAKSKGIRVNQANALRITNELQADVNELNTKAEALVGWPINIASNDQTALQLYKVEQIQDFALPGRKK